MNIGIIKRVEAIENRTKTIETPDFIIINYNWECKKWLINEHFLKAEKKNKILVEHYKDYVIPAKFEGTLLLDLIDCPDEFYSDLFVVNVRKLKKQIKAKGCGVKLEYAFKEEDEPTGVFKATVIAFK